MNVAQNHYFAPGLDDAAAAATAAALRNATKWDGKLWRLSGPAAVFGEEFGPVWPDAAAAAAAAAAFAAIKWLIKAGGQEYKDPGNGDDAPEPEWPKAAGGYQLGGKAAAAAAAATAAAAFAPLPAAVFVPGFRYGAVK